MKRVLLLTSILCTQAVVAMAHADVVKDETCQVSTDLVDSKELAKKGFSLATYQLLTRDGKALKMPMTGTSNLVGPFTKDNDQSKENELAAVLKALHISKMPQVKYFSAEGQPLNLQVKEERNHVMSFDAPQFPLDNSVKMYFEVALTVDKATVKTREKYWARLEKTPIYEKVVFRSKVFSFSEVAADLLAKSKAHSDEGSGTDEILSLLAKNDMKQIAEIVKEDGGIDSLNFLKMLLIEAVRVEGMGESLEEGSDNLLNTLKAAVPQCVVSTKK